MRRIPEENIEAIRDAGLFKLMIPKRLGGHETTIKTQLEVTAELGEACGSTAWVVDADQRLRVVGRRSSATRRSTTSGAPTPTRASPASLAPQRAGVAKVDGGCRVTGRWAWASGSLHASWARVGVHMTDERGETGRLWASSLMPMSELTIEDTWFVAGMKGTGSNTLVAKDVFVPEHRFLSYPAAFAGQLPDRAHR